MKEESTPRSGKHSPAVLDGEEICKTSYMNKGVNDAVGLLLCQANGTDDTLDYS